MINFWRLSCATATRLTEQKLTSGHLLFFQEWQLGFHLKMCDACRRFARQSAAIEQAFRTKLESDETPESDAMDGMLLLSPEIREKLLARLRSDE